METNFNHEQSLTLINEMIIRAQNNVQKERTYSLIFWGYIVAAVAVANFVLLYTLNDPNQSYPVWLIMIPAAIASYFIDRKVDRTALIKTHIDKIGDMVWKGFGISVTVFLIVIYTFAIRIGMSHILNLITPVILTMTGLGQFATACIFRFKPWYWIAVLFWAGASICPFLHGGFQFIVLAVCMILGFVIPGHWLNRQQKKSNV
jgi:hypothetical protein